MRTLVRRLAVALCIVAILFAGFTMPDAAVLPWFFAPLFLCHNGGRPANRIRPLLLALAPRPPPAS
jgi:hypothetical protein